MRDSEPYASPNENDNKPDGLQTSIKIHNSWNELTNDYTNSSFCNFQAKRRLTKKNDNVYIVTRATLGHNAYYEYATL